MPHLEHGTFLFDTGVDDYDIIRALDGEEGGCVIYCQQDGGGQELQEVSFDVTFDGTTFENEYVVVTRSVGGASNQTDMGDQSSPTIFTITAKAQCHVKKMIFDEVYWNKHQWGWKGLTWTNIQWGANIYNDTTRPLSATAGSGTGGISLYVNCTNYPNGSGVPSDGTKSPSGTCWIPRVHVGNNLPKWFADFLSGSFYIDGNRISGAWAGTMQLTLMFPGGGGRAKTTYINRIEAVSHTELFGNAPNTSMGMDVDDYGIGIIRAAANGRVYGTSEEYDDAMNLIGDESAYNNLYGEWMPIGAVRVWNKTISNQPNNSPDSLYGLVGFASASDMLPLSLLGKEGKILASYYWFENDFSTLSYYEEHAPAEFPQWMAGYHIYDGDQIWMPASYNGIENFGSDATKLLMVGVPQPEYQSPTKSKFFLVSLAKGGNGSVIVETDLDGIYTMGMFSIRNYRNIYIAGKDGIIFSNTSGKSFMDKTGDFNLVFGKIDVVKIVPLIRRLS
ncbi:MAG: hypothetical protein HC892_00205 [Saprospiraceae bacterium]|nr:hypothetical protein [Saprospiraceae bacterium]